MGIRAARRLASPDPLLFLCCGAFPSRPAATLAVRREPGGWCAGAWISTSSVATRASATHVVEVDNSPPTFRCRKVNNPRSYSPPVRIGGMNHRLVPLLALFAQLVACGGHSRTSGAPSTTLASMPSAAASTPPARRGPGEPSDAGHPGASRCRRPGLQRSSGSRSPGTAPPGWSAAKTVRLRGSSSCPGSAPAPTPTSCRLPRGCPSARGVVAIDGDLPCWGGEQRLPLLLVGPCPPARARLEKALVAAGVTAIPKEGLTVVDLLGRRGHRGADGGEVAGPLPRSYSSAPRATRRRSTWPEREPWSRCRARAASPPA